MQRQVVSGEELMIAAEGSMKKLLQNPDDGRSLTKASFRSAPPPFSTLFLEGCG